MTLNSEDYLQLCDRGLAVFTEYGQGPCPEDRIVQPRWTMSGAHAMFTEAMKRMYKLADTIPPEDEQNFAIYCFSFTQSMQHHHRLEETVIFPLMEPELKTEVSDEHASFQGGLEKLDDYLRGILGVKQGPRFGDIVEDPNRPRLRYDAQKLKRLLEELVTPLMAHLIHEIDWLAPELLRSRGVTEAKLDAIAVEEGRHIRERTNPFTIHVHLIGHVAPDSQWPPIPWFIKRVLIPWVFYWRYRGAWKYLPYL